MKKFLTRVAFLMATLGFSLGTQAALLFTANLNSLQEVPTNASFATGFGTVLLSDDQTNITVSLFFSGLSGTQTAAHIHGPAIPGVNAPVLFPLPVGQVTNANFTLTPAQVSTLTNELFYFNVHSTVFPGGEIRGQIRAVPVPSTILLTLWGVAAVVARQKKVDLALNRVQPS